MSENKGFCPSCREDVTFIPLQFFVTKNIKGTAITFAEKTAKCSCCGEYISVDEFNEENIQTVQRLYREKNNLVSLDLIREIPKKYNIGRRPLSLVLGWGEHTFSYYYDGKLPSAEYSRVLERIYHEPDFFLSLLKKNASKLKHESSYEQCEKATLALIARKKNFLNKSINEFVRVRMNYLLHLFFLENPELNSFLSQVLLYYIQGFTYAFTSNYMFDIDCFSDFNNIYQNALFSCLLHDYAINAPRQQNDIENVFSAVELSIIHNVIKYFSCYSENTLRKIVNMEEPRQYILWQCHNEKVPKVLIDKERNTQFFLLIKNNYNMTTPNDIKNYSIEIFKNIISL